MINAKVVHDTNVKRYKYVFDISFCFELPLVRRAGIACKLFYIILVFERKKNFCSISFNSANFFSLKNRFFFLLPLNWCDNRLCFSNVRSTIEIGGQTSNTTLRVLSNKTKMVLQNENRNETIINYYCLFHFGTYELGQLPFGWRILIRTGSKHNTIKIIQTQWKNRTKKKSFGLFVADFQCECVKHWFQYWNTSDRSQYFRNKK